MNREQPDSRFVGGLAAGGGAVGLGGILLAAAVVDGPARWWMLGISLAILVVLLGGFWLWRRWRRAGRQSDFRRALLSWFDRSRAGRDANDLADLELLKRKFETLTNEFHKDKRDIYDTPWFLIIGPSGAGKSWVLKGAKLNPLSSEDSTAPSSRLSDKGGRGGTLLMDWWTCPEAIVLDTAGRMVFSEEAKALDSPEWQGLLSLLKENRASCPINGVLVVIPAPLLLLSANELPTGSLTLDDYAEELRRQIRENLQKRLDLRFPIYFIVTKSDRIPGFREYTDDLEAQSRGEKQKQQILGWSNPARIGELRSGGGREDETFDPGVVAEGIRSLARDLRRRRQSLLDKYSGSAAAAGDTETISRDQAGVIQCRAAEMFAFPSAIEGLAEKLESFLGLVFQKDRLAPRAPFVRGVYFTSAMREGEVIDPVRAQSMGIPLGELVLRSGLQRNIEKAFFIKDLLWKKAFPEHGLVMPLVNARKEVTRRKRTVLLGAVAGVTLFLVGVGWGGYVYHSRVSNVVNAWTGAATEASKVLKSPATNPHFLWPVVEPDEKGQWRFSEANLRLLEKTMGREGQVGAFLFSGAKDEATLFEAKRLVFDYGVLRPLAVAAAQIFSNRSATPAGGPVTQEELNRYEDGVVAWVELAYWPASPQAVAPQVLESTARVLDGLAPLVTTNAVGPIGAELKALAGAAYEAPNQPAQWPPAIWTPSQRFLVASNAFVQVSELQRGQMAQFTAEKTNLEALSERLDRLLSDEESFLRDLERGEKTDEELKEDLASVTKKWQQVEEQLQGQKIAQLAVAVREFQARLQKAAERGQDRISNRIAQVRGTMTMRAGTNVLREDLLALLQSMGGQTTRWLSQVASFDAAFTNKIQGLDSQLLSTTTLGAAPGQAVPPVFARRTATYQTLLAPGLIDDLPRAERVQPGFETRLEKSKEDVAQSLADAFRMDKTAAALFPGDLFGDRRGQLTNYLGRRYLEWAIQRWDNYVQKEQSRMAPIQTDAGPEETVEQATKNWERLGTFETVWDGLEPAATSARCRNSSTVNKAKQALTRKRGEMREGLRAAVESAEITAKTGVPLDPNPPDGKLKLMTRNSVVSAWKLSQDWVKQLSDRSLEKLARGSSGALEVATNWGAAFAPLVDVKGRVRKYRVWFPKASELAGRKDFNKDRWSHDVPRFRSWQIDEIGFQADPSAETGAQSSFFPAELRFTIAIGNKAIGNKGEPAGGKLKNELRWPGWSVIELLHRNNLENADEKQIVPLEFTGTGNDGPVEGTVFLGIEADQQ